MNTLKIGNGVMLSVGGASVTRVSVAIRRRIPQAAHFQNALHRPATGRATYR